VPVVFERLVVWRDRTPRPGPENMAVDEWLLETAAVAPLLRVYDWEGDWASFGYFLRFGEVRRQVDLPVLRLVRRLTGGGIVDHRGDRTHTLVVPRHEEIANLRGAESYRRIHGAVAEALAEMGIMASLVKSDSGENSELCFENPVQWDVAGTRGRKLAGAGQRRTRKGLLHQGSVAAAKLDGLTGHLGKALARVVEPWQGELNPEAVEELAGTRYGSPEWLRRR